MGLDARIPGRRLVPGNRRRRARPGAAVAAHRGCRPRHRRRRARPATDRRRCDRRFSAPPSSPAASSASTPAGRLTSPPASPQYNDGDAVQFRALVTGDPEEKTSSVSLRLQAREVLQDGVWQPTSGGVLLRQSLAPPLPVRRPPGDQRQAGDAARSPQLRLPLVPRPPGRRLPGRLPQDNADRRTAAAIRCWRRSTASATDLSSALARALPEPQASLGQGILLGKRSALPQDLTDDLNATSTSHIIALSGYNVTVLAGLMHGGDGVAHRTPAGGVPRPRRHRRLHRLHRRLAEPGARSDHGRALPGRDALGPPQQRPRLARRRRRRHGRPQPHRRPGCLLPAQLRRRRRPHLPDAPASGTHSPVAPLPQASRSLARRPRRRALRDGDDHGRRRHLHPAADGPPLPAAVARRPSREPAGRARLSLHHAHLRGGRALPASSPARWPRLSAGSPGLV